MASDEDEVLTAYHEAGHAVVGCALGAHIECVSLSQASQFDDEDGLPIRYGDCLVNWGKVDPGHPWQQQRELLTILAGPVAEAVYVGGDIDTTHLATWQSDWQQAIRCVSQFHADPLKQSKQLQQTIQRLRQVIAMDNCWAAVASLADQLMLGDEVEGEQVADLVRFWWR